MKMKIMPMNIEVPLKTEEDGGGGFHAGTGLFYLLLCSRLAS